MNLSDRISSVGASATIAITSRAGKMKADGIDVVSFAAGEPDFPTPQVITDATIAALGNNDTKYVPQKAGDLTAAISAKLLAENNLSIPPSQILMTFGAKHGLYLAMQALLNSGDGVLIPSPYWVSYPEMAKLAGANPIIMPTTAENDYKISPQQILDAAPSAKVIILNSPGNPTGVTYTPAELAALAEAISKTDLIVFSDEIYENFIYGDTKFISFAAIDSRLAERTLTFNGLSKSFAMTGWRLGWVAGPADAIGAMKRLMSHSTTNPVSFAQAGALAAYTDPAMNTVVSEMRCQFEKRSIHMTNRLRALKGVSLVSPTGAFYCFPDVSEHFGRTIAGHKITDSLSFAAALLESERVAVVPGSAFGEDKCVRLSFATSMEQIDKGLDRIEKFLSE